MLLFSLDGGYESAFWGWGGVGLIAAILFSCKQQDRNAVTLALVFPVDAFSPAYLLKV